MAIVRRSWSDPINVPAKEWPKGRVTNTTLLLRNIALCLERTPKSRALIYAFDSMEEALRMRKSLSTMARGRLGPGQIAFAVTEHDGKGALWVRRGPNWGNGHQKEEMGDE